MAKIQRRQKSTRADLRYLSVKDFDRMQHYKCRRPPWVKLYNELLDDHAFVSLSLKERFIYCGLLLLASRLDNRIPHDIAYLQDALHTREEIDLSPLFAKNLLLAQSSKPSLAQSTSTPCSQSQSQSQSQSREKAESENEIQGEGDPRGGGCLSEQERKEALMAQEELKKRRVAAGYDENGNGPAGSSYQPKRSMLGTTN